MKISEKLTHATEILSSNIIRTTGALALAGIAILSAPSSAEAAGTSVLNHGACNSEIAHSDPTSVSLQAPGQSNNGPITLVGDKIIIPSAFGGGFACAVK